MTWDLTDVKQPTPGAQPVKTRHEKLRPIVINNQQSPKVGRKVDPATPDWELILPGEPFALSEVQWEGIARCSGLPAEAGRLIGKTIALFHEVERAGRFTAAQTRKQLRGLRKDTLALHARLIEVMANAHAHFALTVPIALPNTFPEPRMGAQRRLEGHLDGLQRLARWFELAGQRVDGMKPGANRKAMNVHWLVGMLDTILEEHTGRKISRSTKGHNTTREYVTMVLKIADPKIRHGTIERAMQERIKLREAITRQQRRQSTR
jgi:hypothetical protein